MKLYDTKGNEHIASAERQPKFKAVFGRAWDYGFLTIDGAEYKASRDYTWGTYWHFLYTPKGRWYRLPCDDGIRPEFTTVKPVPQVKTIMADRSIDGWVEVVTTSIEYEDACHYETVVIDRGTVTSGPYTRKSMSEADHLHRILTYEYTDDITDWARMCGLHECPYCHSDIIIYHMDYYAIYGRLPEGSHAGGMCINCHREMPPDGWYGWNHGFTVLPLKLDTACAEPLGCD